MLDKIVKPELKSAWSVTALGNFNITLRSWQNDAPASKEKKKLNLQSMYMVAYNSR